MASRSATGAVAARSQGRAALAGRLGAGEDGSTAAVGISCGRSSLRAAAVASTGSGDNSINVWKDSPEKTMKLHVIVQKAANAMTPNKTVSMDGCRKAFMALTSASQGVFLRNSYVSHCSSLT